MPIILEEDAGQDSLVMEDLIELVSSFSDELFRIIPEVVYFGFFTRSGTLIFSKKKDPKVKSIIENPMTRVTIIAILGGIERLGNTLMDKIDKVVVRMQQYRIYIIFLKEAFWALIITQGEVSEGIVDYVLFEFSERVEKIL